MAKYKKWKKTCYEWETHLYQCAGLLILIVHRVEQRCYSTVSDSTEKSILSHPNQAQTHTHFVSKNPKSLVLGCPATRRRRRHTTISVIVCTRNWQPSIRDKHIWSLCDVVVDELLLIMIWNDRLSTAFSFDTWPEWTGVNSRVSVQHTDISISIVLRRV